jgi:hypothetical protein
LIVGQTIAGEGRSALLFGTVRSFVRRPLGIIFATPMASQ